MTTVPEDERPPLTLQPPDMDKFNPVTGFGQVNIGVPMIGNSPPGAYQAEPVTGKGKGLGADQPMGPTKPFAPENK